VRKFRDVNTYCSYCYLLAQCWQDVRARIPDPDNTVQRILEEFLAQMRSEAAGCSIREAQAWFSVLHLEPWAGHLGNRQGAITWGSFLGLLSARIDTALRDACQGSGAEALRWLEFLREQACDQTRGWLVKRLAAERLTALPPRLAEAAFQVLESVAAALENHWARIFHEDPVVRSAWGQTSTTVRASLQVAANSPEFSTAALEHQVSHPWDAGCRIELRVPFEARPHPDQNVGGCEAIITVIGGTAVDPGWGKRIPPLLRQLEFHLGDTLWSLDEFFREHCLTVSSVERLVFRDQEELAQWLSPSANDEEEERIRRLSHSWMHSGGPLRLDGDAAATRRQVGQWLIRLQGSARTASPSVGESRPGRSPATARQPKDRRVRITITFTR